MNDIKKIGIQRQSIIGVDKLHFINIQAEMAKKMQKELAEKEDTAIKDALIANGFNPDDHDFLRDNFELIRIDGDRFVHYYFHYGKPDGKRIISIDRKCNIECDRSIENTFTMTLSYKYY